MDRTDEFRLIVRRVFQEVAAMMPSEAELQTKLICDDTLGHYQLGQVGWEKQERVDDIYLHVDVQDGKVWIQNDGTNLRLASWLIREGIPRENIVLAFHHPELRIYTDYAVA